MNRKMILDFMTVLLLSWCSLGLMSWIIPGEEQKAVLFIFLLIGAAFFAGIINGACIVAASGSACNARDPASWRAADWQKAPLGCLECAPFSPNRPVFLNQ